jgi:hypothetical protein
VKLFLALSISILFCICVELYGQIGREGVEWVEHGHFSHYLKYLHDKSLRKEANDEIVVTD